MRPRRLPGESGRRQLSGDAVGGRIRVAARAKLNLYLRVTGRRADGYHTLDSLVAFLDLHDLLAVEAAPDLRLRVAGDFGHALAGASDDNIVLRAAGALAAAAGVPARARLTLDKRIPVAAGLGGGSADAAATLHALAALWAVGNGADLPRIALRLGADVPVCLVGRPTLVGGIGERLAPVARLPQAAVLLVNPGAPASTAAVFARRAGPFSPPAGIDPAAFAAAGDAAALARLLAPLGNDLTEAAAEIVPEIGAALAALAALEGALLARLSGSGATCFALFRDAAAARAGARRIAATHPGWWTAPTRLAAAGRRADPQRVSPPAAPPAR